MCEDEPVRLDSILDRSEGSGIADEIRKLRHPGRVVVSGVEQDNAELTYCRLDLDEAAERWVVLSSNGHEHSYRDGKETFKRRDGTRTVTSTTYEGAVSDILRMAMPERLFWWGTTSAGFSPVLAQDIGTHTLLLTFEHAEDPAFRTTLAIDKRDGIARRRSELGHVFIVTDVATVGDDEILPPFHFEPLTDWIRPEY